MTFVCVCVCVCVCKRERERERVGGRAEGGRGIEGDREAHYTSLPAAEMS